MQDYNLQEITDGQKFDPTSILKDVPFTQASFYGDWHQAMGRQVRRFVVSNARVPVAYLQVIRFPLTRSKNYFYVPYGPLTTDTSAEFLQFLKAELGKIAKEGKGVFVRLDFTPQLPSESLNKVFKPASRSTYHAGFFQPRSEWVLKLNKTEDELLAVINKKNRYLIRLAEKKDVKVEIVTENFDKYFDDFYHLMSTTAQRNGFHLHVKEYYQKIFDSLPTAGQSFLVVAKYGAKTLVIDVIIVYGQTANYFFGASSNEERERVPAYLAQWRAVTKAKELGCRSYNFGGVSSESDPYKGWEGVSAFKKKFGGQELQHSDFYDAVVDSFWYKLYNLRKLVKKVSG